MNEAVLLRRVHDVPWMPVPNVFETWASDTVPPEDLTTAAFAVARKGDGFLFTRYNDNPHDGRWYDFPGGHKEAGESSAAAAVRETFEETCVRVKPVRPIGYYRCRIDGKKPPSWKYPFPESFMAIFLCDIEGEEEFFPSYETAGREYFSVDDLKGMGWREDHLKLLSQL